MKIEKEKFYPPQVDQAISVKKTDRVVKSVIDKYKQRSAVGIKKYGTTLEDNSDGIEVFNPQPHYDNSKGSLYKVATERGWNSYIFDVVKRLERGGKKDPLKQEIEKSIDVLKVWLQDIKQL